MAVTFTEWKPLGHEPIVKLAENLWWVRGDLPGMSLKRVMTAVRLEDGKIAVHSAIAMEPKAQAELEAWGELACLIVPNPGHRLEAPAAMDPVTSGTANGWQMSGGAFEQHR